MNTDRFKFRVWDCIQKKYLNEDDSTLIEQHPNGDINLFFCTIVVNGMEVQLFVKTLNTH